MIDCATAIGVLAARQCGDNHRGSPADNVSFAALTIQLPEIVYIHSTGQ